MAKVGELERIVDNLVNRGLVAPKFVGRQVGQAVINDLRDLGSNLATSQATRASEERSRLSNFQRSLIQAPQMSIGSSSSGSGGSLSKPTLIGSTKSGYAAIASPTSEGIKLRSFKSGGVNQDLIDIAQQNTARPPIELDTIYQGANTFKTLQDLIDNLLFTDRKGQAANIQRLFGQ